ncbi:PPK2 family polyphosphate kinase [Nocardioides limicola]|uniref:PPK2 family polyphosphate kinase n=1 Tax=Nocardioides limicola TaxID=2803368 RepID=UPI00193C5CC4|nr:PPK2 family polyphosphate kinase [Nocardioides sp. DJM-14]
MRSSLLRPAPGPVDLTEFDPSETPGFGDDKEAGEASLQALETELSELQERMFAHRGDQDAPRVLLVLQGMDTAGKGGTIRKAVALVDPQGLKITGFKAPTAEERGHDFLWRVRRALPEPGFIGVFDRSHYEDVLIQRVRAMAPPEEIERRYDAINEFEADLVEGGCRIVKCMLHISAETQRERLLARLDNPAKHWKFNPGDIDERAVWDDYQRAYEITLERNNTDQAPWHIVPSDRKWYRNLAVASLLHETMSAMDLAWPEADFDVEAQRARLLDDPAQR